MKTITKYQADDGSEWGTRTEAMRRDSLYHRVRSAMEMLGPMPVGLKEWEYLQHSRGSYEDARCNIASIIHDHDRDIPIDVSLAAGSMVHRIFDGADCPISKALDRFACISPKTFREYNQPYFAINEDREPIENTRK